MARLLLNAEDLAKVTVGSSWGPFNEALMSLVQLRARRGSPLFDGWRQEVRGRFDPRLAPLLALVPPQGLVDLHTIVGDAPSIPEALERLEGAPDDHVRRELDCLRPSLVGAASWMQRWWRDLSEGDRGARRALVELLGQYYSAAVDQYWGPIGAYLEAERARCARTMAAEGVGGLLGKLHPKIRWRPPFLDTNLDHREVGSEADESRAITILGGRSLVLVPSVFCTNRPWLLWNELDETGPWYVIYPALRTVQDASGLWTGGMPPGQGALSRLLGPTRADALAAVADTSTTTELARRLGVSPATASHHIGILRDAKLVDSSRDGTAVRHRLTALGIVLLDGHREQSIP